MIDAPKVTVITVTYNAGENLQKTLDSLFQQTFTDYELVIIDGKSTDNTLDIIQNNQDRLAFWSSEKDKGIYDAMNKGLEMATGEYVQFLNAGDYYVDPQVLENIFSKAVGSPALIYGDIKRVHTDGRVACQKALNFTFDKLLKEGTGVICHQAMFVKRANAPKYNLKYRFKGELNWYFDLVEEENFTYQHVDTPVVYYLLGGYGYQNFVKNRLDWIRVIYDRYGLKKLIESEILIFLLKNSLRRYPLLAKFHTLITSPIRMIRKISN